MNFFKDLKGDISQAVNDLKEEFDDNQMVNTLEENESKNTEYTSYTEKKNEVLNEIVSDNQDKKEQLDEEGGVVEESIFDDGNVDKEYLEKILDGSTLENEYFMEEEKTEEISKQEEVEEDTKDDVTIITKGTKIVGNITSEGSLRVMGNILGDIECLGKLSLTGDIKGNSMASEIFVNTKRVEGSLSCEGSVEIHAGTVVIGDITGTSGVIAGAVKGEVDINGPIILDSTAVVKGNIKAKSVQINTGAVVDGYCSLSYVDMNIDSFFDEEIV